MHWYEVLGKPVNEENYTFGFAISCWAVDVVDANIFETDVVFVLLDPCAGADLAVVVDVRWVE